MKLIVTDHADPSVGIFTQTWAIECPFDAESEGEDLEFFKDSIVEVFRNFAFGKVTAEYDYELAKESGQ